MAASFVFDLNRCTGCQACVVACWMENRDIQTRPWREVHVYNGSHHPDLPGFQLSLACHHCEKPACLRQCPAGAYTKDAATGAVLIHAERCLGCRYCTWACPHDAPKFDPLDRTIEKCTFCVERLREGQEPACVARCPVEALSLDAERPEAPDQDVVGFPRSDLRPGIRFVALRREEPPLVTAPPPSDVMARFLEQVLLVPEAKITLKGEWTLVVFTTTLSALVAWFAGSLMGGPQVLAMPFLLAGGGAMGLSAWHLGHPERAWRAVLNLRTSWLSREILLASAFLGLGGLHLIFLPQDSALAIATVAAGFAALAAVDHLYRVALQSTFHSAQVLLNALYLMGLLAGNGPLALVAGGLKVILYLHRKLHFAQRGRNPRYVLSLLRLLLGFGSPAVLLGAAPGLAALAAVLGDLVDRCEFYDELEVPSPREGMTTDIKRRLI